MNESKRVSVCDRPKMPLSRRSGGVRECDVMICMHMHARRVHLASAIARTATVTTAFGCFARLLVCGSLRSSFVRATAFLAVYRFVKLDFS